MSATEAATPSKSDGPMRASLWVAQSLIFLAFGLAGLMKVFMPIPELASMWPWTGRFAGADRAYSRSGGVGIALPALTRVKPDLTVLAALDCASDLRDDVPSFAWGDRGDAGQLVLLTLVIFVLWGRLRMPLAAR
jgi:hypothetical protein